MDTESLKRSLLAKFQEVSADRLQKIQLGVLDLEKPTADQAADEVARELHTMKGEARMLGLAAIGQVAHAAEDVLRAERDGRAATEVATDLLLRSCDIISDLLEDIEGAQGGTPASQEMVEALSAASGHPIPPIGGVKASSQPAVPAVPPPAPVVMEVVAEAAEPVYTPPPAAPPSRPAPKAEHHEEPHTTKALADRSIRVNVEVLDSLGLLAGDLLVESARGRLRASEVEALLNRFSRLGDRFLKLADLLQVPNSLRNEVERIESDLHMLRDDAFRFARRNGDGIETLHGNLAMMADHVAEARLVPLSTVFDAFPRAVRDIARAQAKEVDLVIENADLGVDRSMLADVRDALVHLLRNAVDHGLESPDERSMLGKPSAGRLLIRVRADGDMLSIEVVDDGRGMDPQRLREVAVRKRLLTDQQAAALSEREAIELVFRAGFSTREEITDISGRGVGMDVVKKKVESLGGSVGIVSRQGRGTSITLRLPQSLALMKVLLVRLGDDVYGMPAADVVAVMRVKPEDRMEVFGTLAVKHRGKPTALVGLGPLLGVNGGNRFDKPPAVVVRHGDDRGGAGGGRLRGRARGGGEALRRRVPQGRRLHRRYRRAGGRPHRRAPARAGHHDRGAPHGAARHPVPGHQAPAGAAGGRLAHRARHRVRARQGAGAHRGRGPGRRGGLREGPVPGVRSHPHGRADAPAGRLLVHAATQVHRGAGAHSGHRPLLARVAGGQTARGRGGRGCVPRQGRTGRREPGSDHRSSDLRYWKGVAWT